MENKSTMHKDRASMSLLVKNIRLLATATCDCTRGIFFLKLWLVGVRELFSAQKPPFQLPSPTHSPIHSLTHSRYPPTATITSHLQPHTLSLSCVLGDMNRDASDAAPSIGTRPAQPPLSSAPTSPRPGGGMSRSSPRVATKQPFPVTSPSRLVLAHPGEMLRAKGADVEATKSSTALISRLAADAAVGQSEQCSIKHEGAAAVEDATNDDTDGDDEPPQGESAAAAVAGESFTSDEEADDSGEDDDDDDGDGDSDGDQVEEDGPPRPKRVRYSAENEDDAEEAEKQESEDDGEEGSEDRGNDEDYHLPKHSNAGTKHKSTRPPSSHHHEHRHREQQHNNNHTSHAHAHTHTHSGKAPTVGECEWTAESTAILAKACNDYMIENLTPTVVPENEPSLGALFTLDPKYTYEKIAQKVRNMRSQPLSQEGTGKKRKGGQANKLTEADYLTILKEGRRLDVDDFVSFARLGNSLNPVRFALSCYIVVYGERPKWHGRSNTSASSESAKRGRPPKASTPVHKGSLSARTAPKHATAVSLEGMSAAAAATTASGAGRRAHGAGHATSTSRSLPGTPQRHTMARSPAISAETNIAGQYATKLSRSSHHNPPHHSPRQQQQSQQQQRHHHQRQQQDSSNLTTARGVDGPNNYFPLSTPESRAAINEARLPPGPSAATTNYNSRVAATMGAPGASSAASAAASASSSTSFAALSASFLVATPESRRSEKIGHYTMHEVDVGSKTIIGAVIDPTLANLMLRGNIMTLRLLVDTHTKMPLDDMLKGAEPCLLNALRWDLEMPLSERTYTSKYLDSIEYHLAEYAKDQSEAADYIFQKWMFDKRQIVAKAFAKMPVPRHMAEPSASASAAAAAAAAIAAAVPAAASRNMDMDHTEVSSIAAAAAAASSPVAVREAAVTSPAKVGAVIVVADKASPVVAASEHAQQQQQQTPSLSSSLTTAAPVPMDV